MSTSEPFDVFLSHNSRDKPAVLAIGEALKNHGLRVWLDEWELVPGRPWQEALEEVIETTRAAAVLVGRDGFGPWKAREMRACLSQFVDRELPVIPVLLPGAPSEPKLPLFLAGLTWVDLRDGITEDGLRRLVWGIQGAMPPPVSQPPKPAPQTRQAPCTERIAGLYSLTMPVEIVVYVALSEEFDHVFDYLREALGSKPRWEESRNVALSWCTVTVGVGSNAGSSEVAFVFAGQMGSTRSGSVTSVIADTLQPRNLVILGIAGSLTSDLQPGDVFVPKSVNEYLANAAATGDDRTRLFTSGNHHQTDPRLLNRFQSFRMRQSSAFDDWRQQTKRHASDLFGPELRQKLQEGELISRWESRLLAGDDRVLASGPIVGKGQDFVDWLKTEVDRKAAALEMESAGVHEAAFIRTPNPRVIAIRGISDFADERKHRLESTAKDAFRKLAIKNATALLLSSIRAGLFTEDADAEPAPPPQPERYVPWERQEKRALRLLAGGQPVVAFAPKRSGKTCFYRSLVRQLGESCSLVELELRTIPGNVDDFDSFLRWIGSVVVKACQGDSAWITSAWASSEFDIDRFEELLQAWVLPKAERPVLFAMDDAEKLFRHGSRTRLFSLFRSFTQKAEPPWDRFRVLATVNQTLRQLKKSYGQGSFFVNAKMIELDGFEEGQIYALARSHGLELGPDELRRSKEVLDGHPHLTDEIFAEAARSGRSVESCLEEAPQLLEEHLEDCARNLGPDAASAFSELLVRPGLLLDDEVSDQLRGLGLARIQRKKHYVRCSLYRHLGDLL